MADSLLALIKRYDDDHAFLRQFVVPEEDRYLFTSAKWAGEYRWFRANNVICLEKVRAVRRSWDMISEVAGVDGGAEGS